ncbi:MAG: formate hydrogenlyase, partial [Acetobacteraceae bacterium]
MLAALVALIALLVHLSLVLLAAPLLAGVVAWIDARLAGRAGPPLLDPLRELIRLTRKAPALPENASAILAIAPA